MKSRSLVRYGLNSCLRAVSRFSATPPLSCQSSTKTLVTRVVLDRLGYEKGQITAHGFRASFRTICAEQLGARDEVLAAHLGHVPASAHGRAYNRTTFIEERRALMAQWAALVSGS